MRYFKTLSLTALALPVPIPAAPRLEPKPQIECTAEAYRVLIGERDLANTEMSVKFAIRGKLGATYSVELYVEANNTGEKAELLRKTNVKLDGGPGNQEGKAKGEFKLRHRFPDEPISLDKPHLPYGRSTFGWAFILVVKDGKDIIASSGPERAELSRRDVHVKE